MDDLIAALTILRKYGNPQWPTHCNHDELRVCIEATGVTEEDLKQLDSLGFMVDKEDNTFFSYRFGSC